jgi:hypothetical protein
MPTIGYCHDCSLWVYVRPDWSCPSGHAAARVNGWYDSETGTPVAPAAQRADAEAPDGTRAALLNDLLSSLSQNHAYCVGWGPDTDLIVASNPVDPSWGVGDNKAEYGAALKAVEADRSVDFWEQLTERSSGSPCGPVAPETGAAIGAEDPGADPESAIGPGTASWDWGYGTLRLVVEEIAARHGFQVRVQLDRQSAVW